MCFFTIFVVLFHKGGKRSIFLQALTYFHCLFYCTEDIDQVVEVFGGGGLIHRDRYALKENQRVNETKQRESL